MCNGRTTHPSGSQHILAPRGAWRKETMSTPLRRAALIALLAALFVPLLQIVGAGPASAQLPPSPCLAVRNPVTPGPCDADGQAFADSERNGTDKVEIRFGVRNGDQSAVVAIVASVPAEVAASTQCRADRLRTGIPFDADNVPIASDGSIGIPTAGPILGPGETFEVTCLAPQIENCGLTASINVRWFDRSDAMAGPLEDVLNDPVVFSAQAETQVSPECEVESALAPVAVRVGITAEASPRSVYRGDITTWNVTVTNYGNRVMDNAVITDVLHVGLEPPRTLPEGARWDEATRTLRLAVPALAPGESTTISFPTQVRAWSQVPNTISVRTGRHRAAAFADVFGLVDYFS